MACTTQPVQGPRSGHVEVLAQDHERLAALGLDHVARDRAEIGDLAHHPRHRRGILLGTAEHADLLGAHHVPATVALDDVRGAHEARDELVGGALVDLPRRSHLLYAPVREDRYAIAHRQRLVLVVGHVDEGDALAQLALGRLELELHLLAQLEVKRPQRLVQEQHARPVDDRACQCHALALAARELYRAAALDAGQAHHLQRLGGALGALALGHALHPQAVGNVLDDCHMREQRIVLKDRVDRALIRRTARDIRAVELDPAGVGELEAGDHAKRGCLARP